MPVLADIDSTTAPIWVGFMLDIVTARFHIQMRLIAWMVTKAVSCTSIKAGLAPKASTAFRVSVPKITAVRDYLGPAATASEPTVIPGLSFPAIINNG